MKVKITESKNDKQKKLQKVELTEMKTDIK